MAFDDPPMLASALLRDRGAWRAPTEPMPRVPQAEAPRWRSFDDAVGEVVGALSLETDASGVVAALDSLLESGAAVAVGRLLMIDPPPPTDDLVAAAVVFRTRVRDRDHETRGLILEALGLQEQLLPIADVLRERVTEDALAEVFAARAADPLSYLHACPVEIARILLLMERGMLASFGAVYAIEHPTRVPAWLEREVARHWRDGERAMARLYASLAPDAVPEGLVPLSERLDLDALARAQADEDAFLSNLLASNPDEGFIPVHRGAVGS